MRGLEADRTSTMKVERNFIQNSFQGARHTSSRRGSRALDRHRPRRQGPTLELAWIHFAHRRAPDTTPSITAVR